MRVTILAALGVALIGTRFAQAQDIGKPADFASVMAKKKAAKAGIQAKHTTLLEQRYDLSDKPEHQTLRKQLAEATRAWLKKAEDPYELVL